MSTHLVPRRTWSGPAGRPTAAPRTGGQSPVALGTQRPHPAMAVVLAVGLWVLAALLVLVLLWSTASALDVGAWGGPGERGTVVAPGSLPSPRPLPTMS